jgi:HEAT repeat protein
MTVRLRAIVWMLAGLFVVSAAGGAERPSSPLESYRKLEFPPKEENFDKGWEDRVALEAEIINLTDLRDLRSSLRDENPFVRSMAARALGIRGDRASANTLAELVTTDPEYMVRIRAVESLGFLKMRRDVIARAKTDPEPGVQWSALMAARQLESGTDYASLVRQAYAVGITREAMGLARLGQPAPDFTAQTSDGKPFRFSSVLGKKPLALYFAAFDG